MSASSPSPSSTTPAPPSNSTTPSASPPPLSPPPAATPPPTSPPPSSPPPPPAALTLVPPPPVAVSSPPPAGSPPPPASASPPTPALSPPLSTPSPPTVPPPASSPPPTSSPAPPTVLSSPPSPPLSPPPISASPPTSPPPPRARPPARSPPSPPTPDPQSPPPTSSPPTTKSEAPPAPPPPRNSSVSTPATSSSSPPPTQPETSPSPPTRNSSDPTTTQPLPIPTTPPGSLNPPANLTPTTRSNSPDTNTSSGNVTSSKSSGIGAGGVAGISIVAGAAVIFLILGIIWVLRKRKERETGHHGNGYVIPSPYGSSNMSDSSYMKTPTTSAPLVGKGSNSSGYPYSPSEPGGLGNSRSWFMYEELLQVTNGFSEQNLLGEGGFGPVYKGLLADGREVAVKQLKVGGTQGEREFRAEVEIISRIHHRHLVSLVGYCIHESQRLLVYDYVPNNTLHYHLHGKGLPTLDWATRVKVAAGAARGIAYLHEDCHPRIIHRDIKSSNILLDNNFEAQVSDFGLARLALDSFTHVTTRVMGTFGYLAPEYASSGKLTEKSDVYSFGVVLLELVTGRKPVDTTQPLGDESLVEWARPLLSEALESGNVDAVIDSKLEGNYVESEMFRMIEAAAACVRHSAAKRPRMGQVVRALDNVADLLDISNGTRPGESELFDSAQQSAEIRLFQRMAFGSQDYGSDFSQASWRTNSKV